MRLKPLAVLLLIALLSALRPLPRPAAQAEDVVEIGSFEQLFAFSERVARGELTDARAILTADIRATRLMRPIGTALHMFSGAFDGQGHTISRLIALNPRGNAGLFGCVAPEGVVKNVTLDGAVIAGASYSGGIAGYCAGRIEGCRVENSRVACLARTPYGAAAGGVAGLASGRIEGCAALRCEVRAPADAGGVCGAFHAGAVSRCAFEGHVAGKARCGGLAGSLRGGARMRFCAGIGTVTDCCADGGTAALGGAFSGSGATGCLFAGPDAPPFPRRLVEALAAPTQPRGCQGAAAP